MFGILSTLLLVVAQQASSLPFQLELPAGYPAFQSSAEAAEAWISTREDGQASVRISHYLLGALGAQPEAVAADIRRRSWEPMLRGIPHQIEAWKGAIDGLPAAGWEIRYQREQTAMQVIQRLAIQGDSMVVLVWEGPRSEADTMRALLDSFAVPEAWIPAPPPEFDIYRGMGTQGLHQVFPGIFHIRIEIPNWTEDAFFVVQLGWEASPEAPTFDFQWQLPQGAQLDPPTQKLNNKQISYRIPLHEEADFGAPFGISRIGGASFCALDPLWLALPAPHFRQQLWQPPAWDLEILHAANLDVLATPLQEKKFDKKKQASRSLFTAMPAGRSWPFFIVGDFELRQSLGRNWYLRLDSKASLEEDAMQELVRLRKVLDAWLPGATEWTMASYPYIGDRVFPNLILLDEQRDWFRQPVDATFDGLPRRVALARLLCQQRFGTLRHGDGSAFLFLDASLAEYACWRLLQQSQHPEDAEALFTSWQQREAQAGPLPQPLSLLEIGDLYGPKRLLTFGPLVWQAIEQHCGREAFDQWLRQLLAQPGWWSCQDLERDLRRLQPDFNWDFFLRHHLYGRQLPEETS